MTLRKTTALLLFIAIWARALEAAPPHAAQLARECDELMSLAVRRGYGVAWTEDKADPKPKPTGQAVTFEPPGTAAAGFVLYWAGDVLENPKYKQTAFDAVRGMLAVRQPTGQIPPRGLFRPASAGGHETPSLIADRSATRAALGLALCLLDDSGGNDALRRDAASCLNWLLKQQTATGAWPVAFPPAAAPTEGTRLIRLDLPEFRDSVFSMLLATEVLDDARARRSVENSIRLLIRLRLGNVSHGGESLWASSYTLDAGIFDQLPGLPRGIDMLATQHAMQTILAGYIMLDDPPRHGDESRIVWSQPFFDATKAVARLPKFDGKWVRLYYPEAAETPPPPSTQPSGFDKIAPPPPDSQRTGAFGMDIMVEDARNLPDAGRAKFRLAASVGFNLRQRLAATLVGLEDDPLSVEYPVRDEDVSQYVKDRAGKFSPLDEPLPDILSERLRRIYLLLIRVKLEQRMKG